MLHGAHGGLELDQEQEPWSANSIDRAHRVAQVATVDRVARGCWTSSVKKKRLSKTGALKGWSAWGVRGQKGAYWHRVKVQAALSQSGQDSG